MRPTDGIKISGNNKNNSQHLTSTEVNRSNSKKLPPAWTAFHGLFSEVPVTLSQKSSVGSVVAHPPYRTGAGAGAGSGAGAGAGGGIADTSMLETDSWSNLEEDFIFGSQGSNNSGRSNAERDQEAASVSAQATIGVMELFTAALKSLVSLTSDCAEAVIVLQNYSTRTSSTSSSSNSSSSCVEVADWATALLAWCGAWRASWALQRQGSTGGALSPTETVQEVKIKHKLSDTYKCYFEPVN